MLNCSSLWLNPVQYTCTEHNIVYGTSFNSLFLNFQLLYNSVLNEETHFCLGAMQQKRIFCTGAEAKVFHRFLISLCFSSQFQTEKQLLVTQFSQKYWTLLVMKFDTFSHFYLQSWAGGRSQQLPVSLLLRFLIQLYYTLSQSKTLLLAQHYYNQLKVQTHVE